MASWKTRREEAVKTAPKKMSRLSWEEQFDDDPLRADSPTRDVEKEPARFSRQWAAVLTIDSPEQLRLRQQAWVHHMQWARRSALLPNATAAVLAAYTTLTQDSMAPAGQVLLFHANETSAVQTLLAEEPLAAHGGGVWRVFELFESAEKALRRDVRQPYVVLGLHPPSKPSQRAGSGEGFSEVEAHHLASAEEEPERVVTLGRLVEVGGEGCGTLMVLNGLSNKDVRRYLERDPAVRRGSYATLTAAPANLQDVDGLHHAMARTFSQKANLEPLHFMDPEDLLELDVPELASLPHHSDLNTLAMEALKELNASYRYSWLDMTERFGVDSGAEAGARLWNQAMARAQKARLKPVVLSDDGMAFSSGEE